MTSWNGRQFGKYIIHEEVGRGGMARVFRATDTTLQRPVALKILSPQLSSDPESSKRFEREAITAANLRHPNIVTIFDVGEADGVSYIAMEYIAGRTLQAVIDERGALGLGYAVALLAPVAEALDFAHEQNAVHRDIKPHNIMINADGRIMLTDFGIAQTPTAGGQRLTRAGMFMGTPEYIAPEQASAQPVDGRSDLYSLGIVAFELITGQVPFNGTVPELLVAHAYTPPPAITTIVPGLPAQLDKVFSRALAKNPADRPPSAVALLDALRTLAVRTGTIIPERVDLAGLAVPRGSSAGKDTIAMSAVSQLPPAGGLAPQRNDPDAATDVGALTPPRSAAPRPPKAAPVPQPVPRSPAAAISGGGQSQPPRSPGAGGGTRRPQGSHATPAGAPGPNVVRAPGQARSQPRRHATTNDPVKAVFPFLLAFLLVALGVVFWRRAGDSRLVTVAPPTSNGLSGTIVLVETHSPTEVPTAEATPTDTPAPATAESPTDEPALTDEPAQPPTDRPTPRPSATPRPTGQPTATQPPASATPAPPTDPPLPTETPAAPPPTEVPLPTITPEPTTQVTTEVLPSPPPTTIEPLPTLDPPSPTPLLASPTTGTSR